MKKLLSFRVIIFSLFLSLCILQSEKADASVCATGCSSTGLTGATCSNPNPTGYGGSTGYCFCSSAGSTVTPSCIHEYESTCTAAGATAGIEAVKGCATSTGTLYSDCGCANDSRCSSSPCWIDPTPAPTPIQTPTPVAGTVSFSPNNFDFGSLIAGASQTKTVTITNNTGGTCQPCQVFLSNPTAFTITNDSACSILANTGTCVITLTAKPPGVTSYSTTIGLNCASCALTSTLTPTPTPILIPIPTPTPNSCPNWNGSSWLAASQTLNLISCIKCSNGTGLTTVNGYLDPWGNCSLVTCDLSSARTCMGTSLTQGICQCPAYGSTNFNAMSSANRTICCNGAALPTWPRVSPPSNCYYWDRVNNGSTAPPPTTLGLPSYCTCSVTGFNQTCELRSKNWGHFCALFYDVLLVPDAAACQTLACSCPTGVTCAGGHGTHSGSNAACACTCDAGYGWNGTQCVPSS